MAADEALRGLRVLITRPAGRAGTLSAAIAARGGEPVHIPLLAVVPLDPQHDAAICAATAQRLRDLDHYQRVIAISANAVHCGVPWIRVQWPSPPRHIVWYGVGAATVAAFAEYGIAARGGAVGTDAAAGAMTSEALLAAPDLQRVHGERILILRGVGGRERLATALRERGAQVDYAECYRRVAPVLDTEQNARLQDMAFAAICINSNETLRNLWQCLQPAARARARARVVVVPSARVAESARDLGFERVVVAANAGTEATLAALLTLPA